MIVRGTTPYHTFMVPMAADDIDEVYITYLQNNEVVLDKDKTAITIEDVELETENAEVDDTEFIESEEEKEEVVPTSQIILHLTQEDTLKFKFFPAAEKNIAVVQLRILDTNGEAYASDPVHERIFGVLKDGVILSNETNTNSETIGE